MGWITYVAVCVLVTAWILFSGLLAWNHWRVRRERKLKGIAEERPAIRDVRSMHGLVLEGLGFLITTVFARPAALAEPWQAAFSMLGSVLAVVVLYAALRHLGLEWRIKAVVTEDHKLVTTGPYGVMRHPVFAALTCLLIATTLMVNPWWVSAAAVGVSLWGTEIRVRAEDGLLARRFGPEFEAYRKRVAAYLPGVR